ncbi:MAG: hypothetical protein LBU66_07410 [Treponema sp.]|nr:hypothetical protein [Treponema sp.]
MKFKYLIIVFSIIILIIILITALLPLLLAEQDFAISFRYITLPLLIFLALLLICIFVFFLSNYRLFSLLEREDWPALSYYLEQIIFVKGRYSAPKVRLLASSYLVISDYASVLKLENKAMLAKPSVVRKNALVFGTARVLSGNHKEAASFFSAYMDKSRADEKQWLHWYYGFAQLLGGNFNEAEPEFLSLAVNSSSALITGLSSYFLSNNVAKYSLDSEECNAVSEKSRIRVKKAMKNAGGWKREADKMGAEIHIAIIRKYIDEAGKWLFA